MSAWQLAAGSMIGRSHRISGRNNQDAWYYQQSQDGFVAVVTDGCSSGSVSEFGARLGASTLSGELSSQIETNQGIDWGRAERTVLTQMDVVARAMAEPYSLAIEKYFLFTIVAVAATKDQIEVYACGDGFVAVNDAHFELGPFPNNQPPYLAYQLIPERVQLDIGSVGLRQVWSGDVSAVDHLLIGSDGIDDLIRNQQASRPGLTTEVGPIDQFWQSDRYFGGNPELVNRELKLIGRDWPVQSPEHGLLSDDTTLVVARRQPDIEGEDDA